MLAPALHLSAHRSLLRLSPNCASLVATGVALIASLVALPAANSQEPGSERIELARQIQDAVRQLQAIRQEQRRQADLHASRVARTERQVATLREQLDGVKQAVRTGKDELQRLNESLTKDRQSAQDARAWIDLLASAVRPAAAQVRTRVQSGAGDQADRRATALDDVLRLLDDTDPLRRMEGVRAFYRTLGDEWLPARSVTMSNRPIKLAGGDRMVNAWVVGLGLVTKIFVSEDESVVGVRTAGSESWQTDLPLEVRQQILETMNVVREKRPPALTPVPVAIPEAVE